VKKLTTKIVEIWHKHFSDEERQYSEFESSDVEYFVGCMLYNHFKFSKALENLKTMDLSYDFLSECGDEYDEIKSLIAEINFEEESSSLAFLQEFIVDSKAKYKSDELYLLDRLDAHVQAMALRYKENVNAQRIDFQNPLLKK